jgi:hypothetical protein
VRLVALFAGDDIAEHEAALRRLVSLPDRLDVRRSPWTHAHLEEIRAEVNQMAATTERGSIGGSGIGRGTLHLSLWADQEPLALQLHDRYGDRVDITVGFLHFPDRSRRDAHGKIRRIPARERPPLLPSDEIVGSVEEGIEVRSGHTLHSQLRLHNRGPEQVVARTNGQVTALVVDPETSEVVGGYAGAQVLPLVRFSAPSGDSVEIPLLVGTASSVPRLGYAIPPGRWAIEVVLDFGDRGRFRSLLLPFAVVA